MFEIADIEEHFLVNKLHNFVLFSSYIAIFPIQLNMNKLDYTLKTSLIQGVTILRSAISPKTQTTLRLIMWDHASALRCVNSLQHGHHFIHLWPFVRVGIPTSLHYVCKRTWTATRYLWPQIL